MNLPLPHIVTGRKQIAAWFFACLAVPFLIAFAVDELDKDGTFIILTIWGSISLRIFIAATRIKLALLHDGFVYTPSVGASKKLRWADIAETSIEVIPFTSTALFSWNVRTTSGDRVDIQLGYFSRKDMQAFAELLLQQTRARTSTRAKAIAEGRFPWWLF